MIVQKSQAVNKEFLWYESQVFIPGTEFGGIVKDVTSLTKSKTVKFMGDTWRGMLSKKIISPPLGQDYLTVSGELNEVVRKLLQEHFGTWFVVPGESTGVTVKYQFNSWETGIISALGRRRNMQLKFNDGTTLAIQKVTEFGGGLQVLVAGTTPEKLRELFTDPVKTARMTVTERGQVIGEYENYTEFYRTEEYTGKIYGVVVNKVGESVEERLASAEQTIDKTNTDMQMAVAELTMLIASLQGGGAGV